MKKLLIRFGLTLYVFVFLLGSACPFVSADVAWEPDDSFYSRHAEECRYVDEELVAHGPGGVVTVWKSPVQALRIDTIKNGSKVFVDYVYTDKRGYDWGIVLINGKTGWVPMDYLIVDPGLSNFINKHSDEYEQYDSEYMIPNDAGEIFFWSYPGSGEIRGGRKEIGGRKLYIEHVYIDKDGRQWGYVGYFQGMDGWVCMSDPSNDRIPVNEEDAADVVIPPEPETIIKPQPEGFNAIILIAALIAGAAGITIILIRVLFKGNKEKKDNKTN